MAATPASFTQFDALMKELYTDTPPPYSAIKRSPFLAKVRHNKKAHGNHLVVPIEYGNGGGRSNNFTTAQNNTQGASNAKLLITWTSDYADAQFNGDIVDFSEGDGAIIDVMKREIGSKTEKLMNSTCAKLYGDGTGKIGQSSTGDTTNTITLTNKYDVVNFKVNDWIVTSTNSNPSGVRTGNMQIQSIDRVNGVLTFASYMTSSIAAFTPGDLLYQDGDYGLCLTGLRGWLPGKTLTSTNFFGVNRTLDNVELAGWSHDFTSGSIAIEDAIIQASLDVASTDGMPDVCYMHPQDWRKLELSLGNMIRYTDFNGSKNEVPFGFKGIEILAATSTVEVLPDPFCPQGEAFLLTQDTWELHTHGDVPKVLDRDGLYVRYISNADALEARLAVRGNLACTSMKQNSHIYLPVGIGR